MTHRSTDIDSGSEADIIRRQAAEIRRLKHQLRTDPSDHNRALEEAQALTHLGSWEWDVESDSISWSDELYRIYGLAPQEREIDFNEFIDLIYADDRKYVLGVINASYESGKPFEFEHRILVPTGEMRTLRGVGKTIVDDQGKPIRMYGTSQDITQSKQLDRAKDEFISLVSHQLRTPLSVIRMHGGMLEDGVAGPLDPKQEAHIHTMTAASMRMIKLVDDILRISRLSLNRIKINASPTDPQELIAQIVQEFAELAAEKDVAIELVADKKLGLVPVDTALFGEISRNLIDNAIRYSRQSDGKVKVHFSKKAHGYELEVSDNGIGIARSEHGSVFERFYRAQNATSVVSDGNGLGLYIVKLFVEATGGTVNLISEVGEGTTVRVTFPRDGMKATAED